MSYSLVLLYYVTPEIATKSARFQYRSKVSINNDNPFADIDIKLLLK